MPERVVVEVCGLSVHYREKLATNYTIVLVTHNLPQAKRVSDQTAFFNNREADVDGTEVRWGELLR